MYILNWRLPHTYGLPVRRCCRLSPPLPPQHPHTHLPFFPAFVMRRIKAEAVLDSFFASATMRAAASGVPDACAGSLGGDFLLLRCCCCTLLHVAPPFTARSSPTPPETASSPTPPPARPRFFPPPSLLPSNPPVFAASTTSAAVGEAAVRNALQATPPSPSPAPTPKPPDLGQRWVCLRGDRPVLASDTEVDPRGRDRT